MREASCLGYGACEHHERSKTPGPRGHREGDRRRVRASPARRTARRRHNAGADQVFRGPKSAGNTNIV